MTRIFLLLIPLMFAFFGGILLWSEFRVVGVSESSKQWERVSGEIVANEFECTTTHHSRNVTEESCFPIVRYRYEVDGTPYTSERIDASDSQQAFDSHEEASGWAQAVYPVGLAVEVYYDPADPRSALLEPGAIESSSAVESIVTGVIFLLLGLGLTGVLVWFWWFRPRRQAEGAGPT